VAVGGQLVAVGLVVIQVVAIQAAIPVEAEVLEAQVAIFERPRHFDTSNKIRVRSNVADKFSQRRFFKPSDCIHGNNQFVCDVQI
jgi:hypothetical protein